MQLLDLSLEMIFHIGEKLNPVDTATFASTCTSLRMLYPYKDKHRASMRHSLAKIKRLKYKIVRNKNYEGITVSQRISGKAIVSYEFDSDDDLDDDTLIIRYKFPDKMYNRRRLDHDGGYLDGTPFRKFRTKIDKSMWYIVFGGDDGPHEIYRRRLQGSVTFSIHIDNFDHTQVLRITDPNISQEREVPPANYPPWVSH